MTGTDLSKHEPIAPVVEADEDPSGLVRLAIERGVDVEVLERLVGLQERVSDRNARAEFFEALARFQNDVPAIKKTNTAAIATKGGSKYQYTFAPLEEIVRVVRPILKDHGLSFTWTTEGMTANVLNVVCILRHVGGHEERSAFPVPTETAAAMSGAQKLGSALTYGKRQSLTSVLGLTTADEDTDAALEEPPSGPISTEQWAELEALVQEVGADRARFLDWLKVDDLKALPEHRLQQAIDALERKRDTP
jgi:hypothetical protein